MGYRREMNLHPLPQGFLPAASDVICGRGRLARDHPGNVAFRKLVEQEVEKYVRADCKTEKSIVVLDIVKKIYSQSSDGGGGFVKKSEDGSRWCRVSIKEAREKVGQR